MSKNSCGDFVERTVATNRGNVSKEVKRMLQFHEFREVVVSQMNTRSHLRMKKTSKSMETKITKYLNKKELELCIQESNQTLRQFETQAQQSLTLVRQIRNQQIPDEAAYNAEVAKIKEIHRKMEEHITILEAQLAILEELSLL